MKKLLTASALALSSALTITACTNVGAATDTTAPATPMAAHKDAMGMRGDMAKLNLTDAQKAQIKAIYQQNRGDKGERGARMNEWQQKREQVQALVNNKTLNTAQLNQLADAEAAQAKARFVKRVQTEHAIAQVLTKEQRDKLAEMRKERPKKGMHAMRHHDKNAKANMPMNETNR
ncbi:Spy/CpxP family protein refolding chaperone [Psychrobacter aestuarii]|uniref:Spy/CpxP family protein refolding chaperone n=1 Tax=Psychrobacter aestuarii TaxID=556327 RepID=A0ABN0VXF0_9GAMM|nr:Spy/CpxP family protein refolding chaperone [Psychrobacter aestuarii]